MVHPRWHILTEASMSHQRRIRSSRSHIAYSPIMILWYYGTMVLYNYGASLASVWRGFIISLSTCASTLSTCFRLSTFDSSFSVTPPTIGGDVTGDTFDFRLSTCDLVLALGILVLLLMLHCHWLSLTLMLQCHCQCQCLDVPNFYRATVFKGHRQTCRHFKFRYGNRIAPSKEGCRNIPCGVSGFVDWTQLCKFLFCSLDTLFN